MDAVAIVAALVLIEYMVIVWYAGAARGPTGSPRPRYRTPDLERWARVQEHCRATRDLLPGL
jgi:hypothetical protein